MRGAVGITGVRRARIRWVAFWLRPRVWVRSSLLRPMRRRQALVHRLRVEAARLRRKE